MCSAPNYSYNALELKNIHFTFLTRPIWFQIISTRLVV